MFNAMRTEVLDFGSGVVNAILIISIFLYLVVILGVFCLLIAGIFDRPVDVTRKAKKIYWLIYAALWPSWIAAAAGWLVFVSWASTVL